MKIAYSFIIATLLACSACSSSVPTPTEQEIKDKALQTKSDQKTALANFVNQHYKGWAVKGISDGECFSDMICHVHLSKGEEGKVVAVIVREFKNADGSTYWFVYEDYGKHTE